MTDAKAVAAPESHVRLIFHFKVVDDGEVVGNTLSTVHSFLCVDIGSSCSVREMRFGRDESPFFAAVIASFLPLARGIMAERFRGFG